MPATHWITCAQAVKHPHITPTVLHYYRNHIVPPLGRTLRTHPAYTKPLRYLRSDIRQLSTWLTDRNEPEPRIKIGDVTYLLQPLALARYGLRYGNISRWVNEGCPPLGRDDKGNLVKLDRQMINGHPYLNEGQCRSIKTGKASHSNWVTLEEVRRRAKEELGVEGLTQHWLETWRDQGLLDYRRGIPSQWRWSQLAEILQHQRRLAELVQDQPTAEEAERAGLGDSASIRRWAKEGCRWLGFDEHGDLRKLTSWNVLLLLPVKTHGQWHTRYVLGTRFDRRELQKIKERREKAPQPDEPHVDEEGTWLSAAGIKKRNYCLPWYSKRVRKKTIDRFSKTNRDGKLTVFHEGDLRRLLGLPAIEQSAAAQPPTAAESNTARHGRKPNRLTAELYRICWEETRGVEKRAVQLLNVQARDLGGRPVGNRVRDVDTMRLYARRHQKALETQKTL